MKTIDFDIKDYGKGRICLVQMRELSLFKDHPDLKRPGIYLLLSQDQSLQSSLLYIGQARLRKNQEAIYIRVREHEREYPHHFWQEMIALFLTDQDLNQQELRYLENRLWSIFGGLEQYELLNQREPALPNEEIDWIKLERILHAIADKLMEEGFELYLQPTLFDPLVEGKPQD